jgi:hypothetical protein
MTIITRASAKNSVQSQKISLPSDVWKMILEYHCGGNSTACGFRSIFPYRLVNKTFGKLVLDCIKTDRIIINVNTSIFDLEGQRVIHLVCDCKKLQSLHLSLSNVSMTFGVDDCPLYVGELQKMKNHIEELFLKDHETPQETMSFSSNSGNLSLLTLGNEIEIIGQCRKFLRGIVLGPLQSRAISRLRNWKEIHFEILVIGSSGYKI